MRSSFHSIKNRTYYVIVRAMSVHGESYCGIYCGSCPVLRHGETGRADGFIACCAGVPKGELACGGCKSGAVYAGCRVCSFRDCASGRGVERCADCADYPCKAYASWLKVRKLLPHVGEAPSNLEAIRRDGVEAWAAAQKKRWACPRCGAPFSWYERACPACGHDLGDASYAMTGLRKLVCRFLLPRVYRKGKASIAER
jgi:hypothetical protein